MRKIEDKLVYTMGGRLEEIEQREWTDEEVLEILRKEKPDVPEEELIPLIPAKKDRMGKANKPRVILTNSRYAKSVLDEVHMDYEGDVNINDIGFSKMETQQNCMYGTLFIPKLSDVMGEKYKMMFFINKRNIVIVDDDSFSMRIIGRIRRKRSHQANSKAKFIYNFISEFMNKDMMTLANYEKKLMEIEKEVLEDEEFEDFQSQIAPIRAELLTLQEYYDEMMDLGHELEENENHFFAKKELKYFGILSDRSDHLKNKATQLLAYAKQIKEDYQTNMDARQNKSMQMLTIISTIFLPLTLVTSWYGMNFENMPELQKGYPWVIFVCLAIIIFCIIIFKKRKMF